MLLLKIESKIGKASINGRDVAYGPWLFELLNGVSFFKTAIIDETGSIVFAGRNKNASARVPLFLKVTAAEFKAALEDRYNDPYNITLTPVQFSWMSAMFGYGDAIETALAGLKETDRFTYASIRAEIDKSPSYSFEKVMEIFRNPDVAALFPDDLDVSEETLTVHWRKASLFCSDPLNPTRARTRHSNNTQGHR